MGNLRLPKVKDLLSTGFSHSLEIHTYMALRKHSGRFLSAGRWGCIHEKGAIWKDAVVSRIYFRVIGGSEDTVDGGLCVKKYLSS